MIPDYILLPLPVAGPMVFAALLLMLGHFLPKHVPDTVATLVALASGVACAMLAFARATARSSNGSAAGCRATG